MSNTHLDRATILTEALPYIQRYNGKIVVVNCGGVAMDQELRDAFAQTEAYSDLFMELATDAEAAARFINGIIPQGKKAQSSSTSPAPQN